MIKVQTSNYRQGKNKLITDYRKCSCASIGRARDAHIIGHMFGDHKKLIDYMYLYVALDKSVC